MLQFVVPPAILLLTKEPFHRTYEQPNQFYLPRLLQVEKEFKVAKGSQVSLGWLKSRSEHPSTQK